MICLRISTLLKNSKMTPPQIVQEILDCVSDNDLKKAMREIKHLNTTGILKPGVIRITAAALHVRTGMLTSDALSFTQHCLAERAAFKWAGL